MSMKSLFTPAPDSPARTRMIRDSMEEIVHRVGQKSGIDRCHRLDGEPCRVAFSGSPENPSLCLTLTPRRFEGWDYLIAEIDDEVNWCEWDFEDRFAFFDAVVDYISAHMNHRFKRVTETVRHKGVHIREYVMDEQGEWQLFSEEQVNSRFLGLFVRKSEIKETEKEYRI